MWLSFSALSALSWQQGSRQREAPPSRVRSRSVGDRRDISSGSASGGLDCGWQGRTEGERREQRHLM